MDNPAGPAGEVSLERPWGMRGYAWARGAFSVLHGPGYFWVREVWESGPSVEAEVCGKEWRKVWQVARLGMPLLRTASFTARRRRA